MGGPAVTFSGTVVDQSTNDRAHRYTDHPFVHTTAQLADRVGSTRSQHVGLGVMPTGITATPVGRRQVRSWWRTRTS